MKGPFLPAVFVLLLLTTACCHRGTSDLSFTQPMDNLLLGVDWCGDGDGCLPGELRVFQDGGLDFIAPNGKLYHSRLSPESMDDLRALLEDPGFSAALNSASDRPTCFHCEQMWIYDLHRRAWFTIEGASDLPPVFLRFITQLDEMLASELGRPYRRYLRVRDFDE